MRHRLSISAPREIDWGALDARRPGPSASSVAEAIRDRYALEGELVHLASERDSVYRLDRPPKPSLVVRISSPVEPEVSLALQNAVLHAVARTDPSLPVPRIVASRAGLDVEAVNSEHGPFRVRVMSYLPGTPVLQPPRAPTMLASIGRTLARLDEALQSVPVIDHHFPLLWDLRSAPSFSSLVECIPIASGRATAKRVFVELESSGLARLNTLRAQVIHNDFNPKNVLFDAVDRVHVVGVIDFGDVVHSARIVDLGVCLARHMEPEDWRAAPRHILGGYCAVAAISEDELRLLPMIMRARLAMRAVIGSWRLRRADGRGDLGQIESALALLELIAQANPDETIKQWRSAARL